MKNKFLLLLCAILLLFGACAHDDSQGDDEEGLTRPALGRDGINKGKKYGWNAGELGELTATVTGDVTAAQYFYAQGVDAGWNAGNSLDASATSETAWGNPALNQALFNGIREQGFTVVRIPITWGNNSGNYTARLNRAAEVAGYAHTAGLVAIINTHHDNDWLNLDSALNNSSYTTITNQFTTLWTQIANKFKDYGDWLIFEPINEPRVVTGSGSTEVTYWDGAPSGKTGVYEVINKWNQAFVTAVRKTGGNNAHRYLVVKGYAAKPKRVLENVTLPTDTSPDKLIVDFHYYDPGDFCLEGGTTTWNVEDGGNIIKEDFDGFYEKFVKNGIPVIIGECGVSYQAKRAGNAAKEAANSRLAYLEYMGRTARERGLTPILWDNGTSLTTRNSENFCLFNRSNGKANGKTSQEAIDAFMTGVREDPE